MSFAKDRLIPLAVSALLIGCGGQSNDPATLNKENELKEIHEMYFMYIKQNQKPPEAVADLIKKADPVNASGYRVLKNKQYEIVGGIVDLAKNGGAVLAYEKDAPKQGGMVIFADRSVKSLSADELQAALGRGK